MIVFLLAFLVSALSCWLIIRSESLHQHLTADLDLDGVQKFHVVAVPRVGGLAILFGMLAAATWLSLLLSVLPYQSWLLLMVAGPAFFGGITEDMTKRVGVLPRLLLTMMSAVAGYWFLGAALTRLDVPYLDGVLSAWWPLSLLLTAVAVGGVANAINLVDGYNGLAGMVSAGIALCLGFVGYLLGDSFMTLSCLSLAGALFGFLVWNFPFGRIFLGDGGAYFVGFLLAELSVLLVARHPHVSAWFPMLLLFYPVFETLFTIVRRLSTHSGSPGHPDACHLHQMLYKRAVRWHVGSKDPLHRTLRNAFTAPYLWLLWLLSAIPAVLFWRYPVLLLSCCFMFALVYAWLYHCLAHWKTPKWLILRHRAE
jgi:UDP-N-acetylmuramyl pentapeptide phosphotransferase/UDP-N-acetylglucosamine-1-phosphate transferase